jgi:hypothetical protein
MLPFLSKSHIVQIGIVVPDMKKGLAAWSAALGLGVARRASGARAGTAWVHRTVLPDSSPNDRSRR